MESIVECRICGASFLEISWSHLKTHGMTIEEYLEKFPGSTLVSFDLVLRRGSSLSDTLQKSVKVLTSKHIEALREGHKKFLSDPEKYRKWLDSCKKSYHGYERTEEWRLQRSRIIKRAFEDQRLEKDTLRVYPEEIREDLSLVSIKKSYLRV